MTETVVESFAAAARLFDRHDPAPLATVDLLGAGARRSRRPTSRWAWHSRPTRSTTSPRTSEDGRNPTDVELMMFAQANSEHCRHKIFNASWTIDGKGEDKSLFQMIRNTHAASPRGRSSPIPTIPPSWKAPRSSASSRTRSRGGATTGTRRTSS